MLVGRTSELRAIELLLAGARVGDSRVLVLSGEPGIGKTALLSEASALVEGMQLLRAQGVEPEQNVPFAGLLQLLRPLLPLLAYIPEPQASALSSALLLDPTAGREPSRFAVGAATLSLLSRAAEDAPVAVVVDDAHLLDASSAEAIVFAARRLVSDPVAVLAGVREGEPGAALWDSLPTLHVTGLDLRAAAELVSTSSRPVHADELERLHQMTAGNPLGLLELGDQLERLLVVPTGSSLELSEQLTRSFIGRAAELSRDAGVALLVAAADSTSAATVHDACAALGLPSSSLSESIDAGLVSLEGDRVTFRHPLVRSAVYGAAPAETRRDVHRALAGVVPPRETHRLAWHLAESAVGPDEGTATLLDEAATACAARGAHAVAANAHERAAGLTGEPPRLAGRLAAAGESAWMAGQTDRAVDLLERALRAHPGRSLRTHIAEVRGAVETRTGSLESACTTLMAAAAVAAETDPDAAIRLFADAIHVAFYLADPVTAMQACTALQALLDSSTTASTRLLGSMASGMAMVLNGVGAAGVERIREATYELVLPGEVPTDRFRLPLRVQGALWLRDAGPHRQLVSEALAELRDQAALGSLPYLLMQIARDGAASELWDDAEAAYLEAIRLARETGQSTDLGVSLAGLAWLYARQGRGVECLAYASEADDVCGPSHIRLGTFWAAFARGDLASGRGDPDSAAEHYEGLQALLADLGVADPDQSCAPELVETYVHLGRTGDAERVAGPFAVQAGRKAQPWALARSARATGLCSSDPEPHFRSALQLHARTPDLFETARTQLALGSWLRRSRRRREARAQLRSALETFELLGAEPWADRTAHELEATGETAQRRTSSSAEALTPQERQIAQLLAEGRTTRQAAAALFLSPKTVEYHLRHVYIKLGITSRAALAECFPPGGVQRRGRRG